MTQEYERREEYGLTSTRGILVSGIQENFFKQLGELGKSTNTIKNYRTDLQCFNQFLMEYQKTLDINDLTYQKIQQYEEYIGKKYNSDNSRRRRIQTLRIFFDFLIGKKICHENLARKISPSPKFLDIPRPTPLPHVQKLWRHLTTQVAQKKGGSIIEEVITVRNQIIFLLIYCSGLRVSDLEKLQERNVHNGTIPPRVTLIPKKRDPYTIPIHDIFHILYLRYQDLLAQAKAHSELDFSTLLFSANPFKILRGGLSSRGIELLFEGLRNTLTIHVTPKSLRQAAIFTWLNKKYPDTLVKEWLGVAPSYSLKSYREHLPLHRYDDSFLLYH